METASAPGGAVRTARDAADLLEQDLAGAHRERLVVLHLCPDRLPLGCSRAEGCSDEASMPVRLIVMDALKLGARYVIAAHNHPSGDPTPSGSDISATRRLAATLGELGISLEDHLIFAGGECRSLRGLGLL